MTAAVSLVKPTFQSSAAATRHADTSRRSQRENGSLRAIPARAPTRVQAAMDGHCRWFLTTEVCQLRSSSGRKAVNVVVSLARRLPVHRKRKVHPAGAVPTGELVPPPERLLRTSQEANLGRRSLARSCSTSCWKIHSYLSVSDCSSSRYQPLSLSIVTTMAVPPASLAVASK